MSQQRWIAKAVSIETQIMRMLCQLLTSVTAGKSSPSGSKDLWSHATGASLAATLDDDVGVDAGRLTTTECNLPIVVASSCLCSASPLLPPTKRGLPDLEQPTDTPACGCSAACLTR